MLDNLEKDEITVNNENNIQTEINLENNDKYKQCPNIKDTITMLLSIFFLNLFLSLILFDMSSEKSLYSNRTEVFDDITQNNNINLPIVKETHLSLFFYEQTKYFSCTGNVENCNEIDFLNYKSAKSKILKRNAEYIKNK